MKFHLNDHVQFGAYFALSAAKESGESGEDSDNGVAAFAVKATFLAKELKVKPLKTGIFQTDLTDRDDIIIAILSLLLLLVIHAIITSILLRTTSSGAISTFAFSVAQFLELVRDFRRKAFKGTGTVRKKKLNLKLAFVALFVVTTSFGLEILILFFSEPSSIVVTNHDAAFTLVQPNVPNWATVRSAMFATDEDGNSPPMAISPCRMLFLKGVDQGRTRITTCMSTTLLAMETRRYEPVPDEDATEELVIVTLLHEYGSKHFVSIGDFEANYSATAYMRLQDKRRRFIPERNIRVASDGRVKKLHNSLIGFVASAYNNDTGTKRFTEKIVNGLKIKFNASAGEDVSVIKTKVERYHRVVSQRYETRVQIPAVGGPPTLSLANVVFKAATSVRIDHPSDTDLLVNSGNRNQVHGDMWYEKSRGLNWLTLGVLLMGSLSLLMALRWGLKPVSTTELAANVVQNCVGAEIGRSPLEMRDDERSVFSIEMLENWEIDDWDEEVKQERYSNQYRYRSGKEYDT